MFALLALLLFFGIPGLIAYVIALVTYKHRVKTGKSNPGRVRIIVFSLSYVLLLAVEVVVLLSTLSFDR